jgi:hypothetical protein
VDRLHLPIAATLRPTGESCRVTGYHSFFLSANLLAIITLIILTPSSHILIIIHHHQKPYRGGRVIEAEGVKPRVGMIPNAGGTQKGAKSEPAMTVRVLPVIAPQQMHLLVREDGHLQRREKPEVNRGECI